MLGAEVYCLTRTKMQKYQTYSVTDEKWVGFFPQKRKVASAISLCYFASIGNMEAYLVFMHTLVVWWVNGWETGIGVMVAGWGYKYRL